MSDTNLVGQNVQNSDGKTPVSYDVQELMLSNGILDTYLAAHKAVNLKVTLKVLNPALTTSPDFAAEFRATIQTLLKFSSPNLVKLYDYGDSGAFFYLIIEYHRSPTLRAHLDTERRLPLAQAVDYGCIIGDALAYAAGQGVAHGILSPGSVTLSSKRGPLISDLGLGALIGAMLPRALASDPALGIYAAPEVLRGATPDAQSDQYSLAAMVYEMAAGRPPFVGDMQAIINQHISAPPPDPAAIDPALAGLTAVIARAMAKQPNDRYPNLSALIGALREAPHVAIVAPEVAAAPSSPAMSADRTMPEMSVEEIRRAAGIPTPGSIPTPAAPFPAAATPVVPEPAQANFDRTMPEMSIEDIRRAAGVPTPATPPPAPKPPEPAQANFDRTMPEMSIEDIRRAAGVSIPASTPTPKPPAFAPPPPAAAQSSDRTMPEISVEELRRQAGVPTPANIPTPKPPAFAPPPPAAEQSSDRTMPEISVEELRRAAGVPPPAAARPTPPPTPAPQPPPFNPDRTMPDVSIEELRRQAGVPTPANIPTPKATPPRPMSVPYNFDSNAGAAQRHQTDERYRTGPIENAGEMQSVPPAPYNPRGAQQQSVPYNFNSAPPTPAGSQSTIPHDLDEQYGTGRMNRRDLQGPEPGSGITAMIARVPASTPPATQPKRGISPILIILVLVIFMIIAAAIGLGVLHFVLKLF